MSTGVVSNVPPPARRSGQKRQREQTLLDEDEWTDRIEAIIQRDFFPDLPKLQNKLEWLQVGAEPSIDCCSRCNRRSVTACIFVQNNLFAKRLVRSQWLAGCQEWGPFSVAASTAEHSPAPSWHQDTCRSNSSWLWHPRGQLTENSRNWPDTGCCHTFHDPPAGHQCRYRTHRD